MKQRKERLYAPKHLSAEAKEEWRRLMVVLGERVTESDLSLYSDYAQTHADVERLTAAVAKSGSVYHDHNGNPKTHPLAAQLIGSRNQLAALRRDLNLTPRARAEKNQKKTPKRLAGLD